MNNDDMLIKQLLGRYVENRLSIQTVLTDFEFFKMDEVEMRKEIDKRMAQEIALKIINDYDLRDVTVGGNDPNFLGKPIRLETYCFSRVGLMSLITNAFNAGVESTKGSDE
jgi:hypothetical protein